MANDSHSPIVNNANTRNDVNPAAYERATKYTSRHNGTIGFQYVLLSLLMSFHSFTYGRATQRQNSAVWRACMPARDPLTLKHAAFYLKGRLEFHLDLSHKDWPNNGGRCRGPNSSIFSGSLSGGKVSCLLIDNSGKTPPKGR